MWPPRKWAAFAAGPTSGGLEADLRERLSRLIAGLEWGGCPPGSEFGFVVSECESKLALFLMHVPQGSQGLLTVSWCSLDWLAEYSIHPLPVQFYTLVYLCGMTFVLPGASDSIRVMFLCASSLLLLVLVARAPPHSLMVYNIYIYIYIYLYEDW
jgi:hypothetical protein